MSYYMTFDEKKEAKYPTIAKSLSNVTLLPIIDTVMKKYRNSENVVCLPPKKEEELFAIGYDESDDGTSKKERKKEEDNMDNDLSEPRKVKKTAQNKREDETTAGDDDDEAPEYQPNQVELIIVLCGSSTKLPAVLVYRPSRTKLLYSRSPWIVSLAVSEWLYNIE